jgi:hypothetical protein
VWAKNRSSSERLISERHRILLEWAVFTVDSGRSFRAQSQGGDEFLSPIGSVQSEKALSGGLSEDSVLDGETRDWITRTSFEKVNIRSGN